MTLKQQEEWETDRSGNSMPDGFGRYAVHPVSHLTVTRVIKCGVVNLEGRMAPKRLAEGFVTSLGRKA